MPDTTPDKPKNENTHSGNSGPGFFPIAAIAWVIITIPVFLLSGVQTTLQDRERFSPNIVLEIEATDDPQRIILNVTDGFFQYEVDPQVPTNVEAASFTADAAANASPAAQVVFEQVSAATAVEIDTQRIVVQLEPGADLEQVERDLNRSLVRFLLNSRSAIEITALEDENAIALTTTDDAFTYNTFVPALVDEPEVYDSREAAENGSLLARTIIGNSQAIQAMTIEPDRVIVTMSEGTQPAPVQRRVQDAMFNYFPRANLNMDFWLLTIQGSQSTVIGIEPINTQIPLWVYTLAFAGIEALMAYFLMGSKDKIIRPLVRVVGIFLLFWSIFGHEPLWDYILAGLFPDATQLVHPSSSVVQFAAQHMELIVISSLITIPLGLSLGILVTRENFRELLPLVNNLVNSGQTVPTIAIVAVMAPILGFGFWPAIIALVAYGLLPVLRNTIAGIEGVAASVIDSGRGMGMTPAQILFRIELPIASSIIMAGIRTSMVINVGTATLGAFVGSGGLGTPIASGLSMTVDAFIVLGALPAAMLAILIDYILGRIEYVLTPRGLQIES
jgi:osmoprotectant transport system permease protein